jgi:tRNA(Ile)-lysidine synthase TilS/MesJ
MMDTDERLEFVAAILGLLPSNTDWRSRAVYWAFQVAEGASEERIASARTELEEDSPGFAERVEKWLRVNNRVKEHAASVEAERDEAREQLARAMEALKPFSELDRAIGDEWIGDCEKARDVLFDNAPAQREGLDG